MRKIIFLCGLSGAGKSHWAKKLAASTALQRIDLDERIEMAEGRPVAEVFASDGEAHFRELEQQALQEVIAANKTPAVIACGGGTPCFFDNLQLMKLHGYVVYLKASPETILARLKSSYRRPLLMQPNPEKKLLQMLEQRSPFYEQADYIFPAESVSLATFAEIVKLCTNPH